MHLLLASQRLDEGRMRGLESHLSYRIALHTFSAAESRAVLGVPDAHRLAGAGFGVPRGGQRRAGRGSGRRSSRRRRAPSAGPAPAGAAAARRPAAGAGREPAPPGRRRPSRGAAATRPAGRRIRAGAEPARVDAPRVLRTMIAAMVGLGPPAHRVWLPPLDLPPPLDEVLGALGADPGPRVGRCPVGRRLRVPYGLRGPAAGAAAGRARLRPHRARRAPGGGRRAAVGQVDGAVHPACSGSR